MTDHRVAQLLIDAAQALAVGAPILAKYGKRNDEAWAAYTHHVATLHKISVELEAAAKAQIRAGVAIN